MGDLRVIKTEKALFLAFQGLMEKYNFEEITVNMLCEEAMVRRATFYKHFLDKYDFFAWYVKCIQEIFISEYRKKQISEESYFGSLTRELLDFVDENRSFVQHITQSNAYPTLTQIVENTIYQDVLQMIRNYDGNRLMSPEECASFFTGGTVRLVLRKINVPLSEDGKERIIQAVCQMAQLMQLQDTEVT